MTSSRGVYGARRQCGTEASPSTASCTRRPLCIALCSVRALRSAVATISTVAICGSPNASHDNNQTAIMVSTKIFIIMKFKGGTENWTEAQFRFRNSWYKNNNSDLYHKSAASGVTAAAATDRRCYTKSIDRYCCCVLLVYVVGLNK